MFPINGLECRDLLLLCFKPICIYITFVSIFSIKLAVCGFCDIILLIIKYRGVKVYAGYKRDDGVRARADFICQG